MQREMPPGVGAIIASTLRRVPGSLNTDWFGTTLVDGLLRWSHRGFPEVHPFALAWLEHHLKSPDVSRYAGPRSRPVLAGGVAITTYAGHFGLAMPCYELATRFGDARARRVCIEVANVILHKAARNRLGLVAHDDAADFSIPDTCYFAVTTLMLAAELDVERRAVFWEQAVYQLRSYVDVFLMKDTGLAKTILQKDGLGKTYWTRATGWLLLAMTSMLRKLPQAHPQAAAFRRDLELLARGIAGVQDSSGGFHVLLDDPTTPLETTGTAMCAMGLHEAVRRGWLGASYMTAITRAWSFVKGNITVEGNIVRAYTGWAVPAEDHVMSMDQHKMEWIPGFILLVADELTS